MIKLIIREAVPNDAVPLIKHIKTLTAEPGICLPLAPDEFVYTTDEERKLLADSHGSERSIFLVAKAGGRLVGELTCRVRARSKAQMHVAVLGMTVGKGWRNKGIGSRLMQRAVLWARQTKKIKRIELQVFASNLPAIHLYQKFGFVVEGLRKKAVFRHGKFYDDLMMALLLD